MDPPGPFETHSTKAYFNVTLPEKNWTAARIAEHMAAFNVGTIVSTAVHEAYPGHYVQFLYARSSPPRSARSSAPSTNIEGWAHYCEQMMLDEGYASPRRTPRPTRPAQAKLIRLGQLQDALLRDARFIVAIKLHTGSRRGLRHLDHGPGRRLLRQGGLPVPRHRPHGNQARHLRRHLPLLHPRQAADHEAARRPPAPSRAPAFSLEQFHNDFLQQGPAPIKIIRKAMLHDDTPTL